MRRLPSDYVRRLLLIFEALIQNPVPAPEYDVKKLVGFVGTYRIRLGNIRIVYEVDWELRQLHVLTVEFRGRAYK
jgi:mRNA interferase RelE/StbE